MYLRLIVFVITGAVFRAAFAQTRQYYFVNTELNWTDAQSLCRRDYTDLATIEKTADLAIVNTSNFTGKAWIGLFDDWENSWRWSINDSSFYGEGEIAFRNWFSNEPNNVEGKEYCGELFGGSHFGSWNDDDCTVNRPFVCYNGTVNYTASFVIPAGISLSWTDSQKYCRENYVDLASIRNQNENTIITNLANGARVWIGLYGQRQWSDGSHSLFQHWATGQPSSNAEQCIAAGFSDSGRWSDEDCSLTFPAICYTTVPPNADVFVASSQNDSITLQWTKVNDNISFVLQFNGTETNIRAPDGDGPVTHIISSLSAATQYTFTLFSVFKNVSSSGVQLTAATAPQNPEGFRPLTQLDSSITLQWDKVNGNISFVLQFNGTEANIRAPDGDGPVTHTISSLSAATQYTFTLFSVFENVRSTGVSISAATVPPNADVFVASSQNDSITLQWTKVNDNISFVLQFNGTETNIRAPDGDGPVTHTISSLSAATQYTFTLFSVFKNVSSSGVQLTAATAPQNPEGFRPLTQLDSSITLQWDKVNGNISFVLQFNGTEANIRAPDGDGPVTHTISSLSAATQYTFTLFSVFENVRSTGVSISAATAPQNPEGFRPLTQLDSSITLQWDKVNGNISFVLQFNGTEANIRAPDGDGPVTHTISSLSAATQYTFTLFSVFENVRSTGVSITAATVPPNADVFVASSQNDSITLQWTKVNDNISFVLQFNGTETNIRAPDGDGPVTHTISSLSAATQYTFTLFSVFKNVSSSGVQLTAATAPQNPEGFRPLTQLDSSITLQWDKVNGNISFVLQFNGTEANIRAPDGDGPVTHTVSSLSAATQYTFTLFSVFENVRSTGVSITAATVPPNADVFVASSQNDSITLQWTKVNDNISFVLQFNGTETNIRAPDGDGPVTHTISSLSAATQYTFTLFSVFKNVSSSGVQLTAATAPQNPEGFRPLTQLDSSITLQWDKVNGNISFVLQFNGTETNIRAPDGDGPVTHTVSSLSAATQYTFTLFSVFENVRSTGVSITAATALLNAKGFRSSDHNETSITLQWDRVNNIISFVLQFNGTETNISAQHGDGPVTHTVSSLTARTQYTFTLFSVFDNLRSTGVSITAATVKM
ncbi:tenascin-like [Cololabis saira]|uniref:tenascin-like n=1 Tax=Cololabis saira TaxID=129043 RepID=UPI002AD36D19|nr:tenascin-like [Cololabis saira]